VNSHRQQGGRQAGAAVPILTYHSLDESGSVISISPDTFERHMTSLKERGYEALSLGQLLDAWDRGANLPDRAVVLTFDDAFGNFADHAAPVLIRLGFRCTLFVVTGHCGGCNDWASQPPSVPRLPLLSWNALRDLVGAGFEVGAHTVTHPHLPALPSELVEWEISTARETLEDRLGGGVSTFAYPYGSADAPTRAAVAVRYRGACGVRLGRARPSSDRFCLPRVDMYYYRQPWLFKFFHWRVGGIYLQARAAGRACRALLRGSPRTSEDAGES
jgi:peptidoglycan/xylan/chitin deacetylase (PgdA/CDA1 family)